MSRSSYPRGRGGGSYGRSSSIKQQQMPPLHQQQVHAPGHSEWMQPHARGQIPMQHSPQPPEGVIIKGSLKEARAYLAKKPPRELCRALLYAIGPALFNTNSSRGEIEKLLQLADEFVLGIHNRKLTAVIELTNLDETATYLINSLSLQTQRLTVFDALFCSARRDPSAALAQGREAVLCKLVSLAVCASMDVVLDLTAFLMQDYNDIAKAVARSLYHDYFTLLPAASAPLEQVYKLSPTFTSQLLIAYTKLHPIFQTGAGNCPSSQDKPSSPVFPPPLPLIRMISTWLQKCPSLSVALPVSLPKGVALLHPRSSVMHTLSTPLPGLIGWTTLSPLLKGLPKDKITNIDDATDNKITSLTSNINCENFDPKFLFTVDLACKDSVEDINSKNKLKMDNSDNKSTSQQDSAALVKISEEENEIYSIIHVNLLTAMHQQKSTTNEGATNCTGQWLSSEDLSTIVANLIGLAGHVGVTQPRSENYYLLHDSIDRMAQSIQIALYVNLLRLSSDDLASIAATLPRNQILDTVIEHHSQSHAATT